MIKTVVFLTQSHLKWVSLEAFTTIRSAKIRLVLLIHLNENITPTICAQFDEVLRLQGCVTDDVLPVLHYSEILEVLEGEVERAGGADAVRLFCQEECHLLHAARVRERLGIPGDMPDLVIGFRNKLMMKQRVKNAGIRVPKHARFCLSEAIVCPEKSYQRLCNELGAKLVIKPIDSAGSLNVFVVDTFEEYVAAAQKIVASAYAFQYEVDEFIQGTLYQCDSFIHNGEIRFCSTGELGCTNFDYVQGSPLTTFPVTDSALFDKIAVYNERVVHALGMQNGCTHHEFFLDENSGEPIFLEIACRASGGAGILFHIENKGFNLVDACLYQNSLPHLVNKVTIEERNNAVTALLPVGNGLVSALNQPAIISPFEIHWNVAVGAAVSSSSVLDAAGILTLRNDNPKELRADFDALQHFVAVTCRPNTNTSDSS